MLTGGEPLLYRQLDEFTLFLKKNSIKFQVHTNGLSQRGVNYLSFLSQANLNPILNVSSELTNGMQKEFRGGSLPVKFIAKAVAFGLQVDLKVVLHQQLLPLADELYEIIGWWKSIGISSLRFQPVAPIDNLKMENLLLKEDFIPFLDRLSEIIKFDDSLKNFLSLGVGIKYNQVKKGESYTGNYFKLNANLKKIVGLQLSFERSFLPTIENKLYPVKIGRVTVYKNF